MNLQNFWKMPRCPEQLRLTELSFSLKEAAGLGLLLCSAFSQGSPMLFRYRWTSSKNERNFGYRCKRVFGGSDSCWVWRNFAWNVAIVSGPTYLVGASLHSRQTSSSQANSTANPKLRIELAKDSSEESELDNSAEIIRCVYLFHAPAT